jgi:outer membrane protein TolC
VEQLISLANLALKLQMGMPLSTDLTITDALDKLVAAAQPDPNQALNPENRPEYRTAMAGKTLQELNLRNAKAGYLPNLIGFATAGANSGVNDFKNIVKVKDYWFGYQIVGLKLQVPIFDGFQTKYKIKEAQIDLQKTENQVKELTQVFELQLAQSKINLAANSARLQMQKQNMELAQEILRVSQIKYQTGVGSSLEITNAEAGLKEAQTNYFVSLYDFLISKIDYEKALGQL